MAKLSDLIPATAKVLGIPENTVALYARHLREARLITTGGRGPGGAEMKPEDCANLLLALMLAEHAKDAPFAVGLGINLIGQSASWIDAANPEKGGWKHLPQDLEFLTIGGHFYDLLIILIKRAENGKLQSALGKILMPQLRIEFGRPVPTAMISLGGEDQLRNGLSYFHGHFLTDPDAPKEVLEYVAKHHHGSDLRIIYEISHKTIITLGEMLRA